MLVKNYCSETHLQVFALFLPIAPFSPYWSQLEVCIVLPQPALRLYLALSRDPNILSTFTGRVGFHGVFFFKTCMLPSQIFFSLISFASFSIIALKKLETVHRGSGCHR